jgi:hypothetical protein
MSIYNKLCKAHGKLKINNIMYVWDYVDEKAVKESEMTKERFAESEKIRWQSMKK